MILLQRSVGNPVVWFCTPLMHRKQQFLCTKCTVRYYVRSKIRFIKVKGYDTWLGHATSLQNVTSSDLSL